MAIEYNLTEAQLELARWLLKKHQEGLLPESFTITWKLRDNAPAWGLIRGMGDEYHVDFSKMEPLEADGFVKTISKEKVREKKSGVNKQGIFQYGWPAHEKSRTYTLLGRLFRIDTPNSSIGASIETPPTSSPSGPFIDESLIVEIKDSSSDQFDTIRLAKYCEEINDNFERGNFSSVIFLSRAVLDHCPPIFNQSSFASVAANSKGKSFKRVALRLNESLKNIADHHIHRQISPKELLPSLPEIDFSNDLNYLLARIVEILQN